MAERDNVSVRSVSTHSARGGDVDITESLVQPLAVIPIQPASEAALAIGPEQLPSRKFQFSVWHELRNSQVHGSELKAPRVRRGPAEKEKAFYLMVDEDNNKLHHDLRGGRRTRHRDGMESWERAQLASFPHQDLQHGYQASNCGRILGRLKDAAFVNLRDNSLTDVSNKSFPRCEYLNLDNNYLASFSSLPKLRSVRHLSLRDNSIASLKGVDRLRSLPLDELHLSGNPLAFTMGYRQRVFAALPKLQSLDGVLRQEEDLQPCPEEDHQQSACVIS